MPNHGDTVSAHLTYAKSQKKVKMMMHQANRVFEKPTPQGSWAHIRRRLKTKTGATKI